MDFLSFRSNWRGRWFFERAFERDASSQDEVDWVRTSALLGFWVRPPSSPRAISDWSDFYDERLSNKTANIKQQFKKVERWSSGYFQRFHCDCQQCQSTSFLRKQVIIQTLCFQLCNFRHKWRILKFPLNSLERATDVRSVGQRVLMLSRGSTWPAGLRMWRTSCLGKVAASSCWPQQRMTYERENR